MKTFLLATLGAAGLVGCAGAPTTLHGNDLAALDRSCIVATGSHIRRDDAECLPVAGRAYSGGEIDRTGGRDLAQALSLLDPAISLGR
ncbi:MAG: hypothetical protein AB7G76_04670 [Steroidobacteraceae bacterium]